MTPQTIEENPTRSSQEIEQDIRERRDKMDQTLDELSNRLSLRSIVNTAIEWWDEPPSGTQASAASRKALKGLARQIKQHPMPSLLIGGGLAWLVADASDDGNTVSSKPQNRPQGATGSAARSGLAESVGHAKETVAGAIDAAKEKVGEYSETAGEMSHRALIRGKSTVRKIGHEVAHGYEMGTESFSRAIEGYPLGVGLAFAAMGTLLGLALPHSRKEDELMGRKSEELLETAKAKGEQLLETGKEIGGRVLDSVKEEAEEQGFTGRSLAETVGEIAEKSTKVVEKAKVEVVQAMRENGGSKDQLATHPV